MKEEAEAAVETVGYNWRATGVMPFFMS